MSDRKFLIVDGTALLYRAYFAIRELTTRAGEPTNAVFGLVRAMRQFREQCRPTHWVVVFDGGIPDARLALLPEYKAQRPPMPDGLKAQREAVEEFLDLAGIPRMRVEGEEADDVIASLVRIAAPQCRELLIVTSDKDLFQLVTDTVHVLPPAKAASPMGPEQIAAKTGVPPELIPAWLALTGDSSDNIPGVPGVGAKTAAKLLKTFCGLPALWDGIEQVKPPRIRDALLANREAVDRNLEMVRLRSNLPVQHDWETISVRTPDPEKLLPFFEKMEFESMARELRERLSSLNF